MDPNPDQLDASKDRIVRLGTAQTEPGAHIIASIIDEAGIKVRVAGAPTIGSMVFYERQFSIEVLVFEDDYEDARVLIEALPTGERALDAQGRCVLCRYDMTGIDAPICPECGADLGELGGVERYFRLAPAPDEGRLIQGFGAVLGAGVLLMLALSFIAFLIYEAFRPA